MTKRILSILVATAMIFSFFVFTASAEDTRYEGLKYFQSAEDMLKDLNDDSADTTLWDYDDRKAQQDIINAASDAFDADFVANDAKWNEYCERILSRDKNGYVIKYFKLLDISEKNDASLTEAQKTAKNAFLAKDAEYAMNGLSLKESFGKLDGYTSAIGSVISANKATLSAYSLSDEKITEYILKGTKALYQIVFCKTAADMSTAFNTDFLGDGEGKKLIAVMYGKTLTSELVNDAVTSVLIDYINNNFATVKNDSAEVVKAAYGSATEAEIFDFVEKTVVNAYAEKSPETIVDIKLLFGDPSADGDKGALQLMFEALDSTAMINTWFNLALRQHVQLSVSGTEATTLEAGVDADAGRITVKNNCSVIFGVNGLDRYGINANTSFLALGSDWFDVKVYNEDHTLNSNVTYSKENSRFYVTVDSGKSSTYPAYVQLVRNDGTYIETYPITVSNKKSVNSGPSSSKTDAMYYISFEKDGGTVIFDEKYPEGTIVPLTKVPVKEGYLFDGWYSDPEFNNHVTEIVVVGNITLYAKWVEDNGLAGGCCPVPDSLNGEDHFAYVIGYPDGLVRPENNITRAEVASIFFRLLKDEVRDDNLTDENQFTDVNDGDWYNTAVSTLVKLGIINGRTASEFVPNEPITRAEFATICARFDDSEYVITDTFTDISEHWAVSYIRESAARGWIRGYEDNTFRPERLITRAETMTLVNRVLNRAPENAGDLSEYMITWNDNTEASWYYLAVQEATNSHTYEKKNNVYEKWTGVEKSTDWTQYEK